MAGLAAWLARRGAPAPLVRRVAALAPGGGGSGLGARLLSAGAAQGAPDKYSGAMMALHWVMGGCVAVCIATVKLQQWTPKEEPRKCVLA
jgi:hypothetical protein